MNHVTRLLSALLSVACGCYGSACRADLCADYMPNAHVAEIGYTAASATYTVLFWSANSYCTNDTEEMDARYSAYTLTIDAHTATYTFDVTDSRAEPSFETVNGARPIFWGDFSSGSCTGCALTIPADVAPHDIVLLAANGEDSATERGLPADENNYWLLLIFYAPGTDQVEMAFDLPYQKRVVP
jgi:hypothetical protein